MAAPVTTTPVVLNDEPVVASGYAGVVTRGIALGIDAALVQGSLLLIAGLFSLVAGLFGGVQMGPVAKVVSASAWVVITGGYFVIGWSTTGQTIGMRAMELSVLTADTLVPPGFLRSVWRVIWLALCIIPCFLGFVPVLFDSRRRGVQDMLAHTVVLHVDAVPLAGLRARDLG
jgi:uncharacterized RDD family membrane protein YckC